MSVKDNGTFLHRQSEEITFQTELAAKWIVQRINMSPLTAVTTFALSSV